MTPGRISAIVYSALSFTAGAAFLIVTILTGDYTWTTTATGEPAPLRNLRLEMPMPAELQRAA